MRCPDRHEQSKQRAFPRWSLHEPNRGNQLLLHFAASFLLATRAYITAPKGQPGWRRELLQITSLVPLLLSVWTGTLPKKCCLKCSVTGVHTCATRWLHTEKKEKAGGEHCIGQAFLWGRASLYTASPLSIVTIQHIATEAVWEETRLMRLIWVHRWETLTNHRALHGVSGSTGCSTQEEVCTLPCSKHAKNLTKHLPPLHACGICWWNI